MIHGFITIQINNNKIPLLCALQEVIQIVDFKAARIRGGLVEGVHVVLVVAPNALHSTFLNIQLRLPLAPERSKADLRETVIRALSDPLDALLQLEHNLKEIVVEDRPEVDDSVRSVVTNRGQPDAADDNLLVSVERLEMAVVVVAFLSTPGQGRSPQFHGIGGHLEVLYSVAEGHYNAGSEKENEPWVACAHCAPILEELLQERVRVGAQLLDERGGAVVLAGHLVDGVCVHLVVDFRCYA